jgi:hypothetical protein
MSAAPGGYGERVEDPTELQVALAWVHAVTQERHQALLNVV